MVNNMFTKTCLVFLFVNLVYNYSYAQMQVFRKDYNYIEASNSFYKFHTIQKTWFDAKRMCDLEGASLFYPENDNEVQAILSYWNKTQPFQCVFVGISDSVAKGVFETIDGLAVADVYNTWSPGEPNDASGEEDCVVMSKEGLLYDTNCYLKAPFICKKSYQSFIWNSRCQLPTPDYRYITMLDRCYKFHKTPLNWTDAYAVCRAEQSYLVVINSQQEADVIVKLTEFSVPNIRATGNYQRGAVHAGFHNRGNMGWRTVDGKKIEDSGYSVWLWSNNQTVYGDREQCGSLSLNGHLNDISCDSKCVFICEHELDSLQAVLDIRGVGN